MSNVYSRIATADKDTVKQMAAAHSARHRNPQQQAMMQAYIAEVPFPKNAHVLEVGCGTGRVTLVLAELPSVGKVVGVDPSPDFLNEAETLIAGNPKVTLEKGDGRALRFASNTFDAVVFNTVISAMPEPEKGLAEAYRVLKPGGSLAVFDIDPVTASVANGDNDPLQACVGAMFESVVNDRWIVRRLLPILGEIGYTPGPLRNYGFAETDPADYTLTFVDRGVDALLAANRIGKDLGQALRDEGRRRVEAGEYFGQASYVSVVARKPG